VAKDILVMGILFFFAGAAAILWILYLKQKMEIVKLKDSLKGAAEALIRIVELSEEGIPADARLEKSVNASKCALLSMGFSAGKTEEATHGKA